MKATTVDPDEMANYEQSYLDLQHLQIQLLLCLALQGGVTKAVTRLFIPLDLQDATPRKRENDYEKFLFVCVGSFTISS